MTRAVFCCDAGPVRGIGHVMRCLALAEELATRGIECVFVADLAEVAWARSQVTSRGFEVLQRDVFDPAAIEALRPDAVVFDSYDATPSVSAGLRAAGIPLLTIIDGEARGQTGDLYLDANLGSEHRPGPAGTPRLAGLDYALLRSEVLALRPAAPPSGARHDPPRVLAYFGGTDAYAASPAVATALVETGAAFEATIVAPRPELREALASIALQHGQHIDVIDPTDTLMTLAADADLVISASGTSLWELLCIGAAAAVLWVVDNQELGYDRVLAAGTAAGLGHLTEIRSDPAAAAGVLATLLSDVAERDRLRATGWSLVDGQGRSRVADALESLIATRS